MLHLWNPHFSAQTDPTHLDHKSLISWGNSGYLPFSDRWPFGRLAGRFVAPIAQSGPFGPNNAVLWPEINFFVASLKKKLLQLWRDTWKTTSLCWLHCRVSGRPSRSFLGPKFWFFTLHLKSPPFGSQLNPTECDHNKDTSKDPPSSLQISVKIRYQGTKPNGRLRRSTGIAFQTRYIVGYVYCRIQTVIPPDAHVWSGKTT